MSVFDGIGSSILCPKMEKMRPMREQIDGKVVFFSRQSRQSNYVVVVLLVLFIICTKTWRVNNYVSRQGKGTAKTITPNTIVVVCCTISKLSYFILCPTIFLTANNLTFLEKNASVLFAVNHFFRRKWHFEE